MSPATDTARPDTSWNRVRTVALAIPAYNEADGIAGFLQDLDRVLGEFCDHHHFVVVNDVSTDDTLDVLAVVAGQLDGELIVETNPTNRGHGPTVLAAYERALATGADWVLQVDGDGQFEAEDLELLFRHASGGAAIVTGRRDVRFDPWYRSMITGALPFVLRLGFGVARSDVNCPLRLYRSDVIRSILDAVPRDSLTPHVLMTVLEDRHPERHVEVPVQHRPRRGDDETGSTWGNTRRLVVPMKLVRFVGGATGQLVGFRRSL